MKTNSPGRARLRAAALLACLFVLVGCSPHMYDAVPAVHDAKRAEVVGSWLCVDSTEVAFQPDGRAVVSLLDGKEFDFDDGWRLSGTGLWELTDKRTGWNDGQHVRLTLTSRTASATRAPDPDEPLDTPGGNGPAPETYTWTFELRRGAGEQLALYFFFGDPDSRSTYVLNKRQP
ncbi:hypothetical protein ACIGJO_33960 [Streptomyces sp. NPDC079020]|uniref:hypothetical protein n=1 Tax=Streptomyces sp. NPDC079020 TaxID=3365722 RepID=UPI0037CD15D3